MNRASEVTQGKNIVDACISTGVRHVIWSALPNITALTSGVLGNIEHFDSKTDVSEYAESKKAEIGLWVTHFMTGYLKTGIRTLSFSWNETATQIPLLDIVSDMGKYIARVLPLGSKAEGNLSKAYRSELRRSC